VLLHLGAVSYDCWAYVNGHQVRFRRGGDTPFTFKVTDSFNRDGNVLAVYTEDETHSPVWPSGK
jgi:hypothetical protein